MTMCGYCGSEIQPLGNGKVNLSSRAENSVRFLVIGKALLRAVHSGVVHNVIHQL